MNTGGNTIAFNSFQSPQNTEHLAMLMKAQSFNTESMHPLLHPVTAVAVKEDTFCIYLCTAIKMALDIMSWQTLAVMHVS
jgi:hypothetical protein